MRKLSRADYNINNIKAVSIFIKDQGICYTLETNIRKASIFLELPPRKLKRETSFLKNFAYKVCSQFIGYVYQKLNVSRCGFRRKSQPFFCRKL